MGLIAGLLRGVPVWAWALAAALAWGAWQRHSAIRATQALANVQMQTAALREQAMHAALIETTRRLSAQQEVTHAAQVKARQAVQDRAAADAAAGSLRQRASELAARAGACDPAVADGGEAKRLADVLAQSVDRYREVAAAADRAINAGRFCEQSYQSLTP